MDDEGCVESLLVVSDDAPAELCVGISPSDLLELVTTFSTAPSLCAWWRVCCVYTLFTSHSSRQLHKENDEYAKMRNCYSNECVMTKAQARVDHVLTEKIGAIWPASTRWRFTCSLLITFSWCSAARGSIPRSLYSFCSMSTPFSVSSSSSRILTLVVLTFLRCINCSWTAVLDTFRTTSSHDDVYN